jgi:hypothetical protein
MIKTQATAAARMQERGITNLPDQLERISRLLPKNVLRKYSDSARMKSRQFPRHPHHNPAGA